MSLEIIGFPRSNFVRAVRMAAHEKGVDYALAEARPDRLLVIARGAQSV